MKSIVNMKKTIYIILLTVLIIVSITVLQGYEGSSRQEQLVTYDSEIMFRNYMVGNTILNGEIHGSLVAEYIFYKDIVIVKTHYSKYSLRGFRDPNARNYILSLLNEEVKRVYKRGNYSKNEIPYPRYKSFILHGGLPYYIDPGFLSIDPVYRQRIVFSIGTNISILEDRRFKFDPGTGVLVESSIEALIKDGDETGEYKWVLTASSSSNPLHVLETTRAESVFLILAFSISVPTALLAFYIDKRRGFRQ